MAMTLKLVRLDDFIADIDSVDLTSGGYSLAYDGYQPAVAADGDTSVSESITINIQSTSVDGLATLVQALDAKIKQVEWWIENPSVEKYQVWLRVGLNGETNTRQAMILSIKPPTNLPLFNRLIDNNYLLASYTFGIERTPFWENVTATSSSSAVTITGNIGGKVQLGDTVYGDVPARLSELAFDTSTRVGNPSKVWIGFKTSRFGNPANFEPYWSFALSDSTWRSPDVSEATDGYGRNIIQCDFSSSTALIQRLRLRPFDVNPSNYTAQRGAFQVLMIAYCDLNTTCRARIGFAESGAGVSYNPVLRSRVVLQSVISWQAFDMGSVMIPADYVRASDNFSQWTISLNVERISGTGKFYGYGFFFVPLEGMICVSNASDGTIFMRPDGNILARQYDSSNEYPALKATVQPNAWSLPANSEKPYVVAAFDKGMGGSGNNTIDITYKFLERFRTLRGNVA